MSLPSVAGWRGIVNSWRCHKVRRLSCAGYGRLGNFPGGGLGNHFGGGEIRGVSFRFWGTVSDPSKFSRQRTNLWIDGRRVNVAIVQEFSHGRPIALIAEQRILFRKPLALSRAKRATRPVRSPTPRRRISSASVTKSPSRTLPVRSFFGHPSVGFSWSGISSSITGLPLRSTCDHVSPRWGIASLKIQQIRPVTTSRLGLFFRAHGDRPRELPARWRTIPWKTE